MAAYPSEYGAKADAPWAFRIIGAAALLGGAVGTAVWPGVEGTTAHIQCFVLCFFAVALFPVTWLIAWIADQAIRPVWERRKAGRSN